MGFEIERFVDLSPEIAENFKCSVCLDIFDDPLELHCGHIFCSVCIRSLFNNGNQCECPECRRLITSQEVKPPHKKIQSLLHNFTIKCDNANAGCCIVVKLENLQQHSRVCHFNGSQFVPSAPCIESQSSVHNVEQVTILFGNVVTNLTQRASPQSREYFSDEESSSGTSFWHTLRGLLCESIFCQSQEYFSDDGQLLERWCGWRIIEVCTSFWHTLRGLLYENIFCQFWCVIIFALLLMVLLVFMH